MKLITLVTFPFLVLASDYRCTDEGGVCQDSSISCPGYYLSGLCDGSSSRKCCVDDKDYYCTKEGGVCQNTSKSCDGTYASGYWRGLEKCYRGGDS